VRDESSLGGLGENERAQWITLWNDVNRAREKANNRFVANQWHHVLGHEVHYSHHFHKEKGAFYVIELHCRSSDATFHIEGSGKSPLPRLGRRRLLFKPFADGLCYIVVTRIGDSPHIRPYTLTVRKFVK
jgi:hypothetical protein